jgi:hypothetical protein
MDTRFLIGVWIVAIVIAAAAGGPVMMIVGMFVSWLAPFLILGAICLFILAVLGRTLSDGGGDDHGP